MKIIINRSIGGFGVSAMGYRRYGELKGIDVYSGTESMFNYYYTIPVQEYLSKLEKCKDDEKYDLYEKYSFWLNIEHRTDPVLIQVVEELGDKASSKYSKLKVVEIPDDVKWEIREYDGVETIHEISRSWT